jgi:hypothetical protein
MISEVKTGRSTNCRSRDLRIRSIPSGRIRNPYTVQNCLRIGQLLRQTFSVAPVLENDRLHTCEGESIIQYKKILSRTVLVWTTILKYLYSLLNSSNIDEFAFLFSIFEVKRIAMDNVEHFVREKFWIFYEL